MLLDILGEAGTGGKVCMVGARDLAKVLERVLAGGRAGSTSSRTIASAAVGAIGGATAGGVGGRLVADLGNCECGNVVGWSHRY